ncbi:hypothetical protein J1N35_033263 [Gossypium stocksii]|uniref:Uncharacterized protein n=1 Tax=Gossypium stocksii TaxID=47602 RepID=A0A9D3UPZ0_9ROSI|nr:hypothetical protein J1N35_033263 [Gossypium stocksii]
MMLDETIKEKYEIIVKNNAALKANEQELNDTKVIFKKYKNQSEKFDEILAFRRFERDHNELSCTGKKPISPTVFVKSK